MILNYLKFGIEIHLVVIFNFYFSKKKILFYIELLPASPCGNCDRFSEEAFFMKPILQNMFWQSISALQESILYELKTFNESHKRRTETAWRQLSRPINDQLN